MIFPEEKPPLVRGVRFVNGRVVSDELVRRGVVERPRGREMLGSIIVLFD